jgi:gliding motility-associated-like protein
LTLPPTSICENSGIVDLTTIVSASPAGGNFTFAGTGVSGQNFNPSGLSGLIQITVNYSDPSLCTAPSGTLDLTVSNAATMIVPTTPVQVCEGAGLVDLDAYVSGTPGTYVYSGNPAITGGHFFDPSGLSGIQNIVVDYVGSCTAPQVNFDFDVVTTVPPLTISGTSACANAGVVDLTAFVSAAISGGTYNFTGTNVTSAGLFDPTGITGPTTVSINVTYTLPGCGSASGTLPVTILDPATCLPNCFAFTIDIDPLTHRPSCNGGQDGVIALTITGPTANLLVTVYRDGDPMPVPTPGLSGSLFEFTDLGEGSYHYRLEASNGVFCVQDFVWEAIENIQATATSFQDSPCFGTPSGSAVIDATGSSTGQYFFSIDGTVWTEFVPGNVVSGLPGDGTYNLRIGGSENDPCFDVVSVTINELGTALLDTVYVSPVNGFPAVSYPESPTATRVIGIEESGAAPYEVRLQLDDPYGITPNPPFIIDWTVVDETNPQSFIPQKQLDGLYAGAYTLSVRDAVGCEKSFSFIIELDDRIFIPNIFTPNTSDDLNSTFFVRNLPESGSRLSVSDRWGKEVYSSSDYNSGTLWDGGETPDGVYFYRLQIKNGKTYTGWVEILRGTKP